MWISNSTLVTDVQEISLIHDSGIGLGSSMGEDIDRDDSETSKKKYAGHAVFVKTTDFTVD